MWITWLKSPPRFFSSLGGLKSLCRWYFSHSDLAVFSTLSVPVASEFCVRNFFSPFHFLLACPLVPARDLLGLTASCLKCLCHYNPWDFSSKSSCLGCDRCSSWKCRGVSALWDKLLPVGTGIDKTYLGTLTLLQTNFLCTSPKVPARASPQAPTMVNQVSWDGLFSLFLGSPLLGSPSQYTACLDSYACLGLCFVDKYPYLYPPLDLLTQDYLLLTFFFF